MMFDNVFIRYLFILLLSVHLTVSQTTDDTSTDIASISMEESSTATSMEQSTDTESSSTDTSDETMNTGSSLNTENSESSTSSNFAESTMETNMTSSSSNSEEPASISSNTESSTFVDVNTSTLESEIPASSNTMSIVIDTSSEGTAVSVDITSITTNEISASSMDDSPETSPLTPTISDSSDITNTEIVFSSSTDSMTASSDLTVIDLSTSSMYPMDSSSANSAGPVDTASATFQTENELTNLSTDSPSSDTLEITSPSTNEAFSGSSASDTVTSESITPFSAGIASEFSTLSPTEDSSTIASPTAYSPSGELTSEISSVSLSDESSVPTSSSSSEVVSTNTEDNFSPSYASIFPIPTSNTYSTDMTGESPIGIDSTTIPVSISSSSIESTSTVSGVTVPTSEPASEFSKSSTQITDLTQVSSEEHSTTPISDISSLSSTSNIISTGSPYGTVSPDIQLTGSSDSSATQERPSSPSLISTPSAESSITTVTNAYASNSYMSSSVVSASTDVSGITGTSTSSLTNDNSVSSSSVTASFLSTSFPSSTPSLSSISNNFSSVSNSEQPTIQLTTYFSNASASITSFENNTATGGTSFIMIVTTTTTTTTTTTANPNPFIPLQPVRADYQVNQTINSTCSDKDNSFQSLKNYLAPDLIDLVPTSVSNNSDGSYTISYNVSYRGFAKPDPTRIADYIEDRTKSCGSPPSVTKTNNSFCSVNPPQDDCYYCGTESPCAQIPESRCLLPKDNTITYVCECNRSKYFFRTNYEYDGRCSRTSLLWWPQMLAICLLAFLILILLAALLLFLRRRKHMSKKPTAKGEVLSNEPKKTSDFEYIELDNLNSLSNNNTSTYPNIRQPRAIYPVDRSSDYVYRRSSPQNYTYPSRNYPYVQRGVPPAYYHEKNDNLDILDDLFNQNRGSNQRFDVIRDTDDDEIFV